MRNDRIGDLVLTLPAIQAVRRALPQAHLAALVSPYAGPLLAGCADIDELIVDEPSEGASVLARRLRPMRFDAALVFNTNTRNCLAAWRARIRTRVCWGYKPVGFLLGTRRVMLHRSHPPIHEAQFALAFAKAIGADASLESLAPRLPIDPQARRRVTARIERELGTVGPLFGVHPGNRQSAYNWPARYYAELVARLAEFGRVMITGSPGERPLVERVAGQVPANLRGRVGLYTDFQLPELAAAVELLTSLTVSSTGPMHMAGVLDTPVIALFSPHPAHLPAKWAPLGRRHTLLSPPLAEGEDPRIELRRAEAVMARISVDEVLEANLRCARQAMEKQSDDAPLREGERAA